MKKSLVWVVLLGIVFSFNSCKDDPDPISPIVGTWSLSKYVFTELPAGFTDAEGYETTLIFGREQGYTIVFNQDGSYTRAYSMLGIPSLNDKGKYTYEEGTLKLSPDDVDDLDTIEGYRDVPGIQFTVIGDITELRMTMSNTVTLELLPDDWDPEVEPEDEDFKPVDIVLQYVFNKL